jgi:hypothetical protein
MTFDDIKAKWNALSTGKKWLTGGIAALVVLAALGSSDDPDQPYQGYRGNGGQAVMGPNGVPIPVQQSGPGYAPADSSAHDAQLRDWESNQRSQSQMAKGFNQMISDQDTIRDNDTGRVYSDVDGAVAQGAVDSGSYSSVPTAELPVAGDAGGGE